MKNVFRGALTVLAVVSCCISGNAQSSMNVEQSSGTTTFLVADIDKLTFPDVNLAVQKKDASTQTIALGAISSITFSQGITTSVVKEKKEESSVKLYPMPVSNLLNISYSSATNGSVIMQIIDMQGAIVLTSGAMVVKGQNTLSMDLGSIAKGLYLFRLNDGQIIESEKIVKE